MWAVKACVVVLAQFEEALWSEEGQRIAVLLLELLDEALHNMPPPVPPIRICLHNHSLIEPQDLEPCAPTELPVSPQQGLGLSGVQGAHSAFAELLHHVTSASYGHPVPVQFIFLLLDMRYICAFLLEERMKTKQ